MKLSKLVSLHLPHPSTAAEQENNEYIEDIHFNASLISSDQRLNIVSILSSNVKYIKEEWLQ